MRRKVKEAIAILEQLNAPRALLNQRTAMVLLALADLAPSAEWTTVGNPRMSIVGNKRGTGYPGIMEFMRTVYRKKYAENSRETIRRTDIHTLKQLGVVVQNIDDPAIPTNSSKNHYALVPELVDVLRHFGTPKFDELLTSYLKDQTMLNRRYRRAVKNQQINLCLPDGQEIQLSPGSHNELQALIIEQFVPEFDPEAAVLYCGDTTDKYLYIDEVELARLGINMTKASHTKLPDVVLYNSKKKWLYLIEAVTSHGPIGNKRMYTLERMLKDVEVGKIFVTAFLNRTDFRKFSAQIAWETEVWIADNPKHMIHFNGDRFLGPR